MTASFDHIVGAGQERRRDVDAKRPRGLEVVGKLELRVLIWPMASMLLAVCLFSSANADLCYKYLLSHRHVFPFASILARISDFNTLPTLERGRSSQTSICLGVLTLPTRCFTKADSAATSTVRPALGCTTATTRSPHFSSGNPMTAQS